MPDYISEYTGDNCTDIEIFNWNNRLSGRCLAGEISEYCFTGPCEWCEYSRLNNIPDQIEHFVNEGYW